MNNVLDVSSMSTDTSADIYIYPPSPFFSSNPPQKKNTFVLMAVATLLRCFCCCRATDANWMGGAQPGPTAIAAFGVVDMEGSEEACALMDAVVNIPANLTQETGGVLMGRGVDIQLGLGAELVITAEPVVSDGDGSGDGSAATAAPTTAPAELVQWRCKTETDVDYRCSANWQDGAGQAVARIPCGQDDIVFEAASFNIDNSGVPLVSTITIGAEELTSAEAIEAVSSEYKGLARSFIAQESFSSDPATMQAAAIECFDSCPQMNTVMTDGEKYNEQHNSIIARQEFLSTVRSQIDQDSFTAVSQDLITIDEQKQQFGRATLYVFTGAAGKADPTVMVGASKDDVDAFLLEVEAQVDTHFTAQQGRGTGCLYAKGEGSAFSFHPTNCAALAGFAGDKVNACVDGNNANFDECPPTSSLVCTSPATINVATRFATADPRFSGVTCGEFEDVIAWSTAGIDVQQAVTANCCEERQNVAVVGCGFATKSQQVQADVEMFGASLVGITQQILHGANEGNDASPAGTCANAFLSSGTADNFLPVNLNTASGEFLAVGDNEDLDTSIVVAALATADMAKALADWDISEKAADFDEKFHVKKFRGEDPDDRRRRSFKDIKATILERMRTELPFGASLEIDDIVAGVDEAGHDAHLLLKGVSVSWFEMNGVAVIDSSAVESHVANIMLSYGMEAQEYALKLEEYAWLTTSTTTTFTVTSTVTTSTSTKPAEASGAQDFVKDKDGAVLCRSSASPCPDDEKVKTAASALDGLKQVYQIESLAAQRKIDEADSAIANLQDDMATKSDTYKSMKSALDACDKAGVDKISTISYPDGCGDEKAAYDKASAAFILFAQGTARFDFDKQLTKIFQRKGAAMATLTTLQSDYNDDLKSIIAYDAAAHGTEDTVGYKAPEEVKDMQTSFTAVTDEIEALALAVASTQRQLGGLSSESILRASTEKASLEDQESAAEVDLDACTATEEERLSDVPAAVLVQGSRIYDEEVELRERTIVSTCLPFAVELDIIQTQVGSNDAKYASLKSSTEQAFDESSELNDSLEEFAETGKSLLQASINARVEEDEAFPLLYIIIAGAGALVLILIVAVVVMAGGSAGATASNGWAGAAGGETIAFENPVYAGEGGEEGNYDDGNYDDGNYDDAEDDGGGLYDEPEMFTEGGDAAGAGGGYLDVEPDDDDDGESAEDEEESAEDESAEDEEDEEEEDEEEEEEEEEDDDEEEEEEDDDEDDDDEDDEDDEDSDDE